MSEIEILVRVNGKQYALRWWPAVPRIGETVWLENDAVVRVLEVQWEGNRRKDPLRDVLVTLYCEIVKEPSP